VEVGGWTVGRLAGGPTGARCPFLDTAGGRIAVVARWVAVTTGRVAVLVPEPAIVVAAEARWRGADGDTGAGAGLGTAASDV
jgi:hypothetical protein